MHYIFHINVHANSTRNHFLSMQGEGHVNVHVMLNVLAKKEVIVTFFEVVQKEDNVMFDLSVIVPRTEHIAFFDMVVNVSKAQKGVVV